jgi:23S rRNA pseudouridine2605 synthase
VTLDQLAKGLFARVRGKCGDQRPVVEVGPIHAASPFWCIIPSAGETYAGKSARATRIMKERIQKILANAGVASRRNVEEMILQGRVAVNGRVMTQLPILIDPAKDKVKVDDEPVKLAEKGSGRRIYLLMNKPKGVYSTNVAQGEQTRAIDLLPPDFRERVYPVGRLDAESKGLLLLTNDGELTNQLTHPRYGVAKTYRAIVDGFIPPNMVEELQRGVWLADPKSGKGFRTGRSRIKVVKRLHDKSILEITIKEGRNRQVRRMLAKLGHKVRDLTRIRMGPLTLHGLDPGHVRMLTSREIRELKALGRSKNPNDETRNANQ